MVYLLCSQVHGYPLLFIFNLPPDDILSFCFAHGFIILEIGSFLNVLSIFSFLFHLLIVWKNGTVLIIL